MIEVREDEEKDVRSYQMASGKKQYTGNRETTISHSVESSL